MSSHAVAPQPCQQFSYPYSADCVPPTLEECRAPHPIIRINHHSKGGDSYLSYTSFSGHSYMSPGISGYFTAFSTHSNGESGVKESSTLRSDCDGSFETAGSAGFPPSIDQRIDSDESWSSETNSVIDPVTHLPRDYRHLKDVKQPHRSLPAGFCLPPKAIHAPGYWGQSRELFDSEDEDKEPSSSRIRDSTCSGKSHFLSSQPLSTPLTTEDGKVADNHLPNYAAVNGKPKRIARIEGRLVVNPSLQVSSMKGSYFTDPVFMKDSHNYKRKMDVPPTIDEEDDEAVELFNSAVYTPSPLPKQSAFASLRWSLRRTFTSSKSKAKFSKAQA